jgi:hypothetical protein
VWAPFLRAYKTMTNFWSKRGGAEIFLIGTGALVFTGAFLLYSHRIDRSMLYYYGASPEVPGGTAIAVLNPLRNRKDEANAEWLIRDLRTGKCEQIARERLNADPKRICPVLRDNTKASLVWLDPERRDRTRGYSRMLVYDLPEAKTRLVVYFRNSDIGWGVDTVALLR